MRLKSRRFDGRAREPGSLSGGLVRPARLSVACPATDPNSPLSRFRDQSRSDFVITYTEQRAPSPSLRKLLRRQVPFWTSHQDRSSNSDATTFRKGWFDEATAFPVAAERSASLLAVLPRQGQQGGQSAPGGINQSHPVKSAVGLPGAGPPPSPIPPSRTPPRSCQTGPGRGTHPCCTELDGCDLPVGSPTCDGARWRVR